MVLNLVVDHFQLRLQQVLDAVWQYKHQLMMLSGINDADLSHSAQKTVQNVIKCFEQLESIFKVKENL